MVYLPIEGICTIKYILHISDLGHIISCTLETSQWFISQSKESAPSNIYFIFRTLDTSFLVHWRHPNGLSPNRRNLHHQIYTSYFGPWTHHFLYIGDIPMVYLPIEGICTIKYILHISDL